MLAIVFNRMTGVWPMRQMTGSIYAWSCLVRMSPTVGPTWTNSRQPVGLLGLDHHSGFGNTNRKGLDALVFFSVLMMIWWVWNRRLAIATTNKPTCSPTCSGDHQVMLVIAVMLFFHYNHQPHDAQYRFVSVRCFIVQ